MLTDGPELRDGQLREVKGERDGLAVEVAATDDQATAGRERVGGHLATAGKHQWVVSGEFSSMSSTRRRWSRASRLAPCTWGTHLRE